MITEIKNAKKTKMHERNEIKCRWMQTVVKRGVPGVNLLRKMKTE
jgi:hypothetical protein